MKIVKTFWDGKMDKSNLWRQHLYNRRPLRRDLDFMADTLPAKHFMLTICGGHFLRLTYTNKKGLPIQSSMFIGKPAVSGAGDPSLNHQSNIFFW